MAERIRADRIVHPSQTATSQGSWPLLSMLSRGVIIFALSVASAIPATAQEATLAEIVAAWEKNQAGIESLRLEWEEICMEKKGSHYTPEIAKKMGLPEEMANEVYPPEDWEWREKPTLLRKGAMTRYEVVEREYVPKTQGFRWAHFQSSYDGSRSRTLRTVGGKAFGQEEEIEEIIAGLDAWKKPLLLAIRPILSDFDIRNYSIESRNSLVRNVPCIVLRQKMRGPGNYYTLFVDPAQGYSIVKATSMQITGPRFQMEIFYKPIEGIWLPTKWEMGSFTHVTTEIGRTRTATVTRCDLNVPLTQSDFRLDFPPGTRVSRNPMVGPDYVVPGRSTLNWAVWLAALCAGIALLLAVWRWYRWRGNDATWKAIAVFAICVGSASPLSAQEATLAEIISAWKRHESSVTSLSMEWEEVLMEKRGSHFTPETAKVLGVAAFEKLGYYPPTDREWRQLPKLLLAGPMMRYEVSKPVYAIETNAYHNVRYVSSFDGTHSRTYQSAWHVYAQSGTEEPVQHNVDVRMQHMNPILLALKPTASPYARINPTNLEIHFPNSLPDRHGSIMLREAREGRLNYAIHYVSRAADFHIVRSISYSSGKPKFQFDMSYDKDELGQTRLTGWKSSTLDERTGYSQRTSAATVKQFDINCPLTAADFRLDFPPGTLVAVAQSHRQDYIVPAATMSSRRLVWLAGIVLTLIFASVGLIKLSGRFLAYHRVRR